MMDKKLDTIRDKIQQDSSDKWVELGGKGTLELATGVGKCIASFHCGVKMNKIQEIKSILFLAEVVDRKVEVLKDIANYKKFFNIDLKKLFDIQFATYQSAYKWKNKKFDLVIADEIHFSLTPSYASFYKNNSYKFIVGLSATLKDNVDYKNEDGSVYTKKELLKEVAPICYSYDINQAQKDNAARKLIIFTINHKLDTVNKTITAGSKLKPFMQTELSAYNYWDNEFKKSLFISDPEKKNWRIKITSKRRSDLLYNLPSKIEKVKYLLDNLNEQSLVFGINIDPLLKITDNVISSRLTQKENDVIRDAFEKKKIKTIAACKKLEQGANLEGLDALILMSFYSKTRPLIQRAGRIRKSKSKDTGYVFIFKTLNTVEETKWFPKMMEGIEDFKIIECLNVEDAIDKYKNYKL